MPSTRFLLTFVLLAIPSVARLLPAQTGRPFKLVSVKVIGSTRYEESEIIRAAGLKLAEAVTPDTLKEAADRLGTAGVFAELHYRYQTRGEELTVQFTVKDATKFLPCTFENFVWLSKDELLSGVRSRVPLFDGQAPPSGELLERVSSALEAMLQERGIQAEVESSPWGRLGGPVERMEFRVVGIPLPVLKVAFTGVQKVDAALLQEAARPLVGKDFGASFIEDFSNSSIASVYRQRGYLQARFGDPVPQLLKGEGPPNSVLVTIPVREGEQYRLKEIAWLGQSVIPYTDLEKSIRLAPGGVVDAVQLDQDVFALPALFWAKGYLAAEVKAKALLDEPTHAAAYQMQINQGDLFTMGKLEIAGLDDAHVRSIEKLCRLHTGDTYDRSYWNTLIQQVSRSLPPSASGWKAGWQETMHADTKTVDVKLTFAPRASR
jgi:outer membrane protein insertion porin family